MKAGSTGDAFLGELRREDVTEFIENFWTAKHYAPSFREIMVGCGFNSTSSVAHHLSVLRDEGKVDYIDHIARSIRVTK